MIALLSIAPVATLAEKPAPGPKSEKTNKPNKVAGDELVLNDDQWKLVDSFMSAESPKKWDMVRKLPERQLKQRLKQGIARRYRDLQTIKEADGERFVIELQAIHVEDDIYGVLQDLRSKKEVDQNEARLRERVGVLIDNRGEWKKIRLKRVEKELAAMKMDKALAALQEEMRKDEFSRESQLGKKRREEQVDRRVAEFKQHMNNPPKLRPPLPGNPPVEPTPDTLPTALPIGE